MSDLDFDACVAFMNLSPDFLKLKQAEQLEELEDKYLFLCKQYHPDNQQTGDADKFNKLQKVYEILKIYVNMDESDNNNNNMSSSFFVRCTLSELYTGCHKTVKYNNCIGHVQIPAGTMDGQQIPVVMCNVMGQIIGNYPIIVLEVNDTALRRSGSDLLLTLNISLKQALAGEPITVTLLGQKLVKVPVCISASDQRVIIEDCGMPLLGQTDEYGDLIVSYRITFPSSEQEMEDLQEFLASC